LLENQGIQAILTEQTDTDLGLQPTFVLSDKAEGDDGDRQ